MKCQVLWCPSQSHDPNVAPDIYLCRKHIDAWRDHLTENPGAVVDHWISDNWLTGQCEPDVTPQHYGGADNPYEAIKVIEAWRLGFNLGNTLKYICRMGKKDGAPPIADLRKARFYLDREIQNMEKAGGK